MCFTCCWFLLPPVAVIVMTSAILLPVITTLGFDPYWFAIVFTINMEIGLITPPVGLNLYIIKGITPDVSLGEILKGSIPFIGMMILCILILCIFPEIVTWLPDKLMGKDAGFLKKIISSIADVGKGILGKSFLKKEIWLL